MMPGRLVSMLRLPCAALLAGLACGSAGAAEVGVTWFGTSDMADRVLEGLQQGLARLDAGVTLEVRKDLTGPDEMAAVLREWEGSKQAVVVMRSSGAVWLAQHPLKIPAFIGAANHPTELGAIMDCQAPEGNITGVTYALPKDAQFEIFKAILPGMDSVCLLVEDGHPSAPIEQADTREACRKLGLTYTEGVCATLDRVLAAAAENAGQVSAIVIGSQALIMDNAAAIVAEAGATPVLSYSEEPVRSGALGGIVAADIKLGRMLAQSVVDVVIKGRSVSEVPVKFDTQPAFVFNAKTAQRLKLEIPYEILSSAIIVE